MLPNRPPSPRVVPVVCIACGWVVTTTGDPAPWTQILAHQCPKGARP
jgi:hypothetical protein